MWLIINTSEKSGWMHGEHPRADIDQTSMNVEARDIVGTSRFKNSFVRTSNRCRLIIRRGVKWRALLYSTFDVVLEPFNAGVAQDVDKKGLSRDLAVVSVWDFISTSSGRPVVAARLTFSAVSTSTTDSVRPRGALGLIFFSRDSIWRLAQRFEQGRRAARFAVSHNKCDACTRLPLSCESPSSK